MKKKRVAVAKEVKGGKAVPMSGLHGWRCQNGCAAKKRFVSVVRDTSGGKEADKSNRAVGFTVMRSLKVLRTLLSEEKTQ